MSNLGDLRQDAQRLAGQNTRIKVCGLKRPEDIEWVNLAKPDFCGFIVEFPRSSRCVSRELLAKLTAQLDPEIIPVGVFVNAPVKLPAELAESGVIRAIQLHGQEDEEYIRRLRRLIGGDIPVIQAFSVQTAEDLQRAAESSADYVLLERSTAHGESRSMASARLSVPRPPASRNGLVKPSARLQSKVFPVPPLP